MQRKWVNLLRIFLIIGLCSLLFGCGENGQEANDHISEDNSVTKGDEGMDSSFKKKKDVNKRKLANMIKKKDVQPESIATKLTVEEKDGQFILDFTLENISGKDLMFTFSSGQEYDFFVYNDKNELVYRWSDGKMFIMAIHETMLAAGEKFNFQEKWDGMDKEGKMVPDGNYTIVFTVTANVAAHDKTEVPKSELEGTTQIEIKR